MLAKDAKIGMKIVFGRPNGEKTTGRIIKINQKSLKVETFESRGSNGRAPAATVWRVAPSLCSPCND